MTELGEVLREIQYVKERLYGIEHDEGDIPAIRTHLEMLNSKVEKNADKSNKNRLLIYALVAFLAGSSGVSIWGVLQIVA